MPWVLPARKPFTASPQPSSSDTKTVAIQQCNPFALECRLVQQIELGIHTQFIGEILEIKADEDVLTDAGALDVEKVRPFFYAPDAQAYYGTGAVLGKAFRAGRTKVKRATGAAE